MISTGYVGHGNKEIVERIKEIPREDLKEFRRIDVRRQIAHEIISIAYGFLSPLEGFMNYEETEKVINEMHLPNGVLWPIPILFDLSEEEVKEVKYSDELLLTYDSKPLALIQVDEIFEFDKEKIAKNVYGTLDLKHPGVKRTFEYKKKFLAGKIFLINQPSFVYPFKKFWLTPSQHRKIFQQRGWKNIVAFQTRNVPHTGHEYLMKFAWFSANEDLEVDEVRTGILVNVIVGEKRVGDYIDEAILLSHEALNEYGYFDKSVHMVSFTLWDMRYAGPKEAVLHAIIRSNLGCTHHIFGRDHAGVGNFYKPYEAHEIFRKINRKELRIKPIFMRENYYCPICGTIENEILCGHKSQKQEFSGSLIRSILLDGVKPTKMLMRPEVYEVVKRCANEYGFGSEFVTEEYLRRRKIFTLD
ncbi:MAG: sulfate adenylyltransferase [Sulfolobaceae archaeon]